MSHTGTAGLPIPENRSCPGSVKKVRGRIVALVVSSACRGQGIGQQLVQAAENAAAELSCAVVEVTSARSRTDFHPFYQNLGYQDWGDRSVRYLKDL